MASKRMFSQELCRSDRFLSMDFELQALYFQLALDSDDDGACANPLSIARMCRCAEKDLDELERLGYIFRFPSGVVFIRHWFQLNEVRADRKKGTHFVDELAQLTLDPSKVYQLAGSCRTTDNQVTTDCQPDVSQVSPQYSVGKHRVNQSRVGEGNASGFTPPTVEEVESYVKESGLAIDPQRFHDYYSSRGWYAGNVQMTDWKACIRNWQRSDDKKTRSDRNRIRTDEEYAIPAEEDARSWIL